MGVEFDGQFQPALHEIHVAHDGAPGDFEFLGHLVAIGIRLFLDQAMESHHALPWWAAE